MSLALALLGFAGAADALVAVPYPMIAPVLNPSLDVLAKLQHFQLEESEDLLCYEPGLESYMSKERTLPSRLALGVHRKTGYIMSYFVAQCFGGPSEVDRVQAQEMMGGDGSPDRKYVHMSRDPIDLVVSNYLYNKKTSNEPGTLMAGTAKTHMKRCKNLFPEVARSLPPPRADRESLRRYLKNNDEDTGLLLTMCETMSIVNLMVEVTGWCNATASCMEVRLETLMRDSETFTKTWKRIARFAGFEWSPELQRCLEAQDTNTPAFAGAWHCSSQKVSPGERSLVKQRAAEMDAKVFGGVYVNASRAMG